VYNENSKAAYIESAEIVGLKKVPGKFRNPLELNTKTLGELLRKISIDVLDHKLNIEKIIIGIGGTATVDFGLGVASIFGLKLFDENKNLVDIKPGNYYKVKYLEIPDIRLPFTLQVISDVDTPLFGEDNSIQMYSAQKGADQKDIQLLVNGFDNIYKYLINNKLIDFSKPINGAGGGLAAGLNIFFEAEIISSTEFINSQILNDIDQNQIDAVITGEGAFDEQSLENKGAHIIIQKFKELKIPIFLVCGTMDESVIHRLPSNVHLIELRKYFTSVEESIKNYVVGLKKAAVEIINHLKN
ncbi:MAG: glycerate kinase, partial [Ignavibacteriaceae bacterium]|nr:glycerate kinase [Ignavibacteriaceae bacterium]